MQGGSLQAVGNDFRRWAVACSSVYDLCIFVLIRSRSGYGRTAFRACGCSVRLSGIAFRNGVTACFCRYILGFVFVNFAIIWGYVVRSGRGIIVWSETHHGVKEEVTEQGDTTFYYKIATNPEIAKNLKGHLLLVHGDIDDNVHPGNTTRVVNALIKAGKRFDMLMLPNQRHSFGDMNEYFYWRLVDYFSEHLRGKSEKFVDIPKR